MKSLKSIQLKLILLAIVVFIFTSCASKCGMPDPISNQLLDPLTYGFFGGVLHGIVMPFAFIVSLASPCIEIYASNNIGSWYDFGYLIGVMSSIGGGFKASELVRKELA